MVRGSYTIWCIYLAFEIRAELRRAKKFFYKAVGECPLVEHALGLLQHRALVLQYNVA
jgi:hypothetical protein